MGAVLGDPHRPLSRMGKSRDEAEARERTWRSWLDKRRTLVQSPSHRQAEMVWLIQEGERGAWWVIAWRHAGRRCAGEGAETSHILTHRQQELVCLTGVAWACVRPQSWPPLQHTSSNKATPPNSATTQPHLPLVWSI